VPRSASPSVFPSAAEVEEDAPVLACEDEDALATKFFVENLEGGGGGGAGAGGPSIYSHALSRSLSCLPRRGINPNAHTGGHSCGGWFT
jgi:hypothetical protein